jgi:rSAM/selenodomain-associated transferase 1
MKPAIAVFAKAPIAGLAKTRLVPALGADGAAALAARLLEHAATQAVAAALGPVTLWATPDLSHPVWSRLQNQLGLALALQPDGDLGQRMAHAFFSTSGPLLLTGTDMPGLDAAVLREAAAQLASHDAVFVPALDGGYGLAGLHQATPATLQLLFGGMTWSTPTVMAVTRQRLAAAGLRHAELPALPDIDEPADLHHVPPALLPTLGRRPRGAA